MVVFKMMELDLEKAADYEPRSFDTGPRLGTLTILDTPAFLGSSKCVIF